MTINVTVYRNAETGELYSDLNDIVKDMLDSDDLPSYADWLDEEYYACDLVELWELVDSNRIDSAIEAVAKSKNKYDKYLREKAEHLLEVSNTYYTLEIPIDFVQTVLENKDKMTCEEKQTLVKALLA